MTYQSHLSDCVSSSAIDRAGLKGFEAKIQTAAEFQLCQPEVMQSRALVVVCLNC